MIKFKHKTSNEGAIAYYFYDKMHYDRAIEALKKSPSGTHHLACIADFAINCETNELVKNRLGSLNAGRGDLEKIFDLFLKPQCMQQAQA